MTNKRRNFLKMACYSVAGAFGAAWSLGCGKKEGAAAAGGDLAAQLAEKTREAESFKELAVMAEDGAGAAAAAPETEGVSRAMEEQPEMPETAAPVREIGRSTPRGTETQGKPCYNDFSGTRPCTSGKTVCSKDDTDKCKDWHVCGQGHSGTCAGELYCTSGKLPVECKKKVKNAGEL